METTPSWSLNRVLSLLLAGGLLLLFVDIRHEHVSALRDEPASWIPLIFTAVAVTVMLATVASWKPGWRATLTAVYIASLVVGLAGVYFHIDGKLGRLVSTLFAQNTAAPPAPGLIRLVDSHGDRDGRSHGAKDDDDAPVLAPLAFVGIGLIGLAGTSRRLKPE